MSHLTDEQLEDILQGRVDASGHVEWCPQCQAHLEEKRALALRVRQAFSSIHADHGLAERIRAQVAAAGPSTPGPGARRRLFSLDARRRIWPAVAVAAAILMVALPRGLHLETGAQVKAAQTALIGIHLANLGSRDEPMEDGDISRPCPCTKGQLAGGRAMPCCQRGLCECGCQMRDFQGHQVESCVIQEPNAPPVSVVVVPKSPQALGMNQTGTTTGTGQAVWQAACGACNMASVRRDQDSCCVIGEVPPEDLVGLLNAFEE